MPRSQKRPFSWVVVTGIAVGVGCAKPSPPPKAAQVGVSPCAAAPAAPEPAKPPPSDFVYGRVSDENNRPPRLGHARVLDAGRQVVEAVKLGSDGRFALNRPALQGSVAWLEFTGVDHRQTTALIAADTRGAEVTVHLGTYGSPAPGRAIAVIPYAYMRPGRPITMTRQPDGKYAADVPAPGGSLMYELEGIVGEGRRVNGTLSDSYIYDGGGDYLSMVWAQGNAVHVVYDPSRRPRAALASSIAVAPSNPTNTELVRLSGILSQLDDAQLRRADGSVTDEQTVNRLHADLAGLTESQDPLVRRAALVAALGHYAAWEDLSRMAPQALAQLEPNDPIWAMAECAIVTAVDLAGGPQRNAAYVTEFVDRQPVAGPVGCYLFSQLNKQPPIDAEHARTAVRLLKDRRFAFTRYAAFAGDYDPDRPLAPGKLLPEFRATALDGRTTISSAVLRGKLYLIEVWGPWCGPCVAEMPSLHAAYEKYGKRGKRKLHVLSIALDTTREDVAKFRTAPHPMPWEHALATDAEKMALRKIFGSGVPAYALIDERGTVLAATPQLRGPEFERVLSRLDEPRKPK